MRKSQKEPNRPITTKIHPKPLKKKQQEEILDLVDLSLKILKSFYNTMENLIKKKDHLLEEEEPSYQEIDNINAQIDKIQKQIAVETALIDNIKKANPEYFQEEIKQQKKEDDEENLLISEEDDTLSSQVYGSSSLRSEYSGSSKTNITASSFLLSWGDCWSIKSKIWKFFSLKQSTNLSKTTEKLEGFMKKSMGKADYNNNDHKKKI